MGLLDKVLGNAEEVDMAEVQEDLAPILADNERIERAFKVIRDMYIFTSGRLLLIDKQGMTGKKVDYTSIPYKSITTFTVETAGHFDMDAELKLYISGHREALTKELKAGSDVVGIQKLLANKILK